MKKILAGIPLTALFLAFPLLLLAQPYTRTTTQEVRQEQRTAQKAALDARRVAEIQQYADRAFGRFDDVVGRLGTLADRIDARLTKLADAGMDVSKPRADLASARASIAVAKAALADTKTKLSATLVSANPKESFKNVRTLLNTAKDALKKAHADLVNVIREIKPGQLPKTGTAAPSSQQ